MGISRRSACLGLLAPLAACGGGPRPEAAVPPRRFVYDDVHRYNAAVAAIRDGADPAGAFQAYIDGAGEGLRTWLGVYPFDAAELVRQWERRPRYFASLATLPARIAPLEPEIARAFARMEALWPGADLGAVYFLVGRYNAGGTARDPGSMLAVEFFGLTPQTDMSEFDGNTVLYDLNELAQIAVHEGCHNLQRQIQHEANFVSIYTDPSRMTMRNFAIREGVADYVTYLVAGRAMTARQTFGNAHEAEIWAEFRPLMNDAIFAQPGWFQDAFADGRQWPNQMGYFVGYKMAEHVHASAADPDAALIELLSPHTDAQFQSIADRYAAKFGG